MCHPEVPEGLETPSVTREEVQIALSDGASMPALRVSPETGSGPGVLIAHDIFGRSPFYENLAARLATAGFTTLLPDYFHRLWAIPRRELPLAFARRAKLDENQTLDDLDQAVTWLREQSGGERLGTVGFCMGGTLVLDLAARRDDLATVCYYGFVVEEAHEAATKAPVPTDVAEQLRGPIVGFWGDQDHGIKMPDVERFAEKVRTLGVDFQHTIYPGAGHGFMANSGLIEGTPGYEAACDSWARALDFFRQHLGVRMPVAA